MLRRIRKICQKCGSTKKVKKYSDGMFCDECIIEEYMRALRRM